MSESNKQQAVNKLIEIVANFTAMISTRMPDDVVGNDSNLLIVFYVQIMPDDFVMQLHRF
ncbi:pilus assembly protein [Escherichia coli]|nr:pilus assembly protein [Escherichia coli]